MTSTTTSTRASRPERGLRAKHSYTSQRQYKGVIVKGNTITILMAKTFPDMPYWGSFPAMGPIPAGEDSDPATYKNHPWATGPYMFSPGGYVPGQSLTLVRNPHWDANTDPGRHQYLDQIDFDFSTDTASIESTILADKGQGQTTLSYDSISAADYEKFSTKSADLLVTGSEPCTSMWYPDNRKITDVNVRRAIGWAYPYKAAWAAGGYIQDITPLPVSNVMPPGVPGRFAYNPLFGHEPGTTSPAKAKALLRKSGNLGYEIRFAYQSDVPASVAEKDAIKQSLEKAGFTVSPVATTSSRIVQSFLQNPDAPINVRSSSRCADWPSGRSWLEPEFQTTNISTFGFGSNYAAFSSPVIDNRMKEIQQLPLQKQPAAWNELEREIQTKYYPVVVTGYGGAAMLRGSKVHGFNIDDTLGMPTFKDLWIG